MTTEVVRRFEDILDQVHRYNPDANTDLLRKAYVFSAREHRDQTRRSGEPYLTHPLEVAYLLAEMHLDTHSIVAGLLHDVVEDTLTTLENLNEHFGADVAHIVEGVTKISKLKFATKEQAEAENLRKMILAMVDDIRVILVKLADRMHNMRTLEYLSPLKRQRIARETREIYAPLANRLGMGRIKSELEDLCFRYLEPEAYEALDEELASRRRLRDTFIDETRGRLEKAIAESGIEAEITGRIKTISSIYRKMQDQKIGVEEVYDYIAFRIVTGSVKDCYGALGVVHSIWRPVPGRFKDYIAMPKPNMYQSLHTSLMTDRGQPFEVQIRTGEMHRIAEEGIAAHWQYKDDSDLTGQDAQKVAWLRQILDLQQDLKDPRDFVNLVKVDLYPEDVYAFTPQGRVISFRRGATPIDFAYAVHTEVGHHCVGAKANGKIVPLKYELQNGDIIEILTHPNRNPSRDWLALAKTSRAKSKIRAWLNANARQRSVALGRELTDREFRKFKRSVKQFDAAALQKALSKLGMAEIDDFYAAVGYGKSTPQSLLSQLVPENLEAKPEGVVARVVKRALGRGDSIKVTGMEDMMISLAKCCNPVRGEPIIGYITRGKGVSVHAADCSNVGQLMYDSERRIDVDWGSRAGDGERFDIKLLLDVVDQQGLLAKIVSAVSETNTNIKTVDAQTFETDDARITMIVSVTDLRQMKQVMTRIRRLKGVRAVQRALR